MRLFKQKAIEPVISPGLLNQEGVEVFKQVINDADFERFVRLDFSRVQFVHTRRGGASEEYKLLFEGRHLFTLTFCFDPYPYIWGMSLVAAPYNDTITDPSLFVEVAKAFVDARSRADERKKSWVRSVASSYNEEIQKCKNEENID